MNTVRGYRRKGQLDSEGVQPLYREARMGAREKHRAKIGAAANWFRRGGEVKEEFLKEMGRPVHRRKPWIKGAPPKEAGDTREVEGVVFLLHTEGSSLQKVMQKAEDQVTKALVMSRTKYVEKGEPP